MSALEQNAGVQKKHLSDAGVLLKRNLISDRTRLRWRWYALIFVIATTAIYGAAIGRRIYLNSVPRVYHGGETSKLEFSVRNDSGLFSIRQMSWICGVQIVGNQHRREIAAYDSSVHRTNLILEPGDPPTDLDCSLSLLLDPADISTAHAMIAINYTIFALDLFPLWRGVITVPVRWLDARWRDEL